MLKRHSERWLPGLPEEVRWGVAFDRGMPERIELTTWEAFDAYWGGQTQAWDVAAGALMLQEAGGTITNPDGGELDINRPRFVAAGTRELHAEMMKLVGEEPT